MLRRLGLIVAGMLLFAVLLPAYWLAIGAFLKANFGGNDSLFYIGIMAAFALSGVTTVWLVSEVR